MKGRRMGVEGEWSYERRRRMCRVEGEVGLYVWRRGLRLGDRERWC